MIKKYYKKFMAMLMVLFTSFQCVLPTFANEMETVTSNIQVTVEGNGIVELTESQNTVQVTKDSPYTASLNVGTNVHFSIIEQENLTIEDFAFNNTTVESFVADTQSFTYDYKTIESDAIFTIRFKEKEVTSSNEEPKIDEVVKQETEKEDISITKKTEEEQQKEEDIKDDADVIKSESLNIDFSINMPTEEEQRIVSDYRNGIDKPEYLELRKKKAEESGLWKYVDENYFLNDSYYSLYDINMLNFDGLNILNRYLLKHVAQAEIEKTLSWDAKEKSRPILMQKPSTQLYVAPRSLQVTDMAEHTLLNGVGTLFNGIWTLSNGEEAFCAEGLQAPPNVGDRTETPIVSNNVNLRKALYYGYGGPKDILTSRYGASGAIVITDDLVSYAYSGKSIGHDAVANGYHWNNLIGGIWKEITAKPNPTNFTAYVVPVPGKGNNYAGQYVDKQVLAYGIHNPTGSLKLTKKSANPSITNNNPCYSLEGAQYGLYGSRANANANKERLNTFTIGANGQSNEITGLTAQKYYVKEIKAPKGYALDTTVYEVEVKSGQLTTKEFVDYPQSDPVNILLGKMDKETNANKPQGSASLENAHFAVKYYNGLYDSNPAQSGVTPTRTWVLKTDVDGYTELSQNYKVSGDEFFYASNGDTTLPLGTITIQEIKAPVGYKINNEVFVRKIIPEGNVEWVDTYNQPTIPEQVIRFTVKKVQEGTNTVIPGTKFIHTKPNGQKETLTTNDKGQFVITGLETGVHSIQEESVMDGYVVNKTKVEFRINANGSVDMLTDLKGTGITFGKDNAENGVLTVSDKLADFKLQIKKINDHNKLLKGAEFTLYSDKECTKKIDSAVTDEKGILQFKGLKDRTKYYFKETKAPKGYRIPVDEKGNAHVYELMVESTPASDTFDFYVDGKKYTKDDFNVNNPVHWEGTKKERIINVTVTNKVGIQLPETGSVWTGILFFMGVACMTIAVLHKRIMKEE